MMSRPSSAPDRRAKRNHEEPGVNRVPPFAVRAVVCADATACRVGFRRQAYNSVLVKWNFTPAASAATRRVSAALRSRRIGLGILKSFRLAVT